MTLEPIAKLSFQSSNIQKRKNSLFVFYINEYFIAEFYTQTLRSFQVMRNLTFKYEQCKYDGIYISIIYIYQINLQADVCSK